MPTRADVGLVETVCFAGKTRRLLSNDSFLSLSLCRHRSNSGLFSVLFLQIDLTWPYIRSEYKAYYQFSVDPPLLPLTVMRNQVSKFGPARKVPSRAIHTTCRPYSRWKV